MDQNRPNPPPIDEFNVWRSRGASSDTESSVKHIFFLNSENMSYVRKYILIYWTARFSISQEQIMVSRNNTLTNQNQPQSAFGAPLQQNQQQPQQHQQTNAEISAIGVAKIFNQRFFFLKIFGFWSKDDVQWVFFMRVVV